MVATPIGNLADFSPRAVEILQSVDIIACEDTRHSQKLLQAFNIKKKLLALHVHNEYSKAKQVIAEIIEQDICLAYLSDAGTPGVSDPGADLAREAHLQGVPVFSICGPSALTSSLSVNGFANKTTVFVGFFPRDSRERIEVISKAQKVGPCTLVYYESPQRILQSARFLKERLPSDTLVCVSREISKIFESHKVAPLLSIEETILQSPLKGEYVISVSIQATNETKEEEHTLNDVAQIALEEKNSGVNLRDAARKLSLKSGKFSARDIYQKALSLSKVTIDE
jgi:16S rRNA (cytidine1402-2'-O)-methyltransferase